MNDLEAMNKVKLFNETFMKLPWLDFEVAECSPQAIVLRFGIDLTVQEVCEIRFQEIFFVKILMAWHTDTANRILSLMVDDEMRAMNADNEIEQGFHLFTFQPEDLTDRARCVIAAQTFSWFDPARK